MAKGDRASKGDANLQVRFGVVVRTCRQNLGITQEELAWRASMHRTYIADIERGARNVTLRSIASLASALQLTPGELLSYVTMSAETAICFGDEATSDQLGEILMVEDNPVDADLAMRALKQVKMTNPMKVVRDAEHGLDYLFGTGRYAKRKPLAPRLILLDLNLPRMSGLEFLRRIKGEARTRDIPVVVMTVSRSDRVIMECARIGVENYIVKPLSFDNLCKVTAKFSLRWTLVQPANEQTNPNSRQGRVTPFGDADPKSGDPSISAPPCIVA